MLVSCLRLLIVLFALWLAGDARGLSASEEQMRRGQSIFVEKCLLCHQAAGQGAPPVYPPLAKSDWLMADRSRTIKVLCEGLSGTITVNGQTYSNSMPAQVLDDAEVADVLTFVMNSWGNESDPFTAEEVRAVRATTRFKTYAALAKAAAFQPLPSAPSGWTVREVAQLPEFCTRLASRGAGSPVYVLSQNGSVFVLDLIVGAVSPLISARDYLDPSRGDLVALGMTQDRDGRLWIVTNQRLSEGSKLVTNEVVIYRTAAAASSPAPKPEPWFKTSYPYGIGSFNHGVSHIAFGPDGKLYLSSGSRTDGGEPGKDPRYFTGGEVETTACLWRLDVAAEKPEIEVLGSGLRNAYGFAWNSDGNLFTVSNGPDANAPEEMDCIAPGRHYGFPYQFANWPVRPAHPYKHTPPPPPGVEFTLPVRNLGPAAGGRADQPLFTFDAHSSPAGMIWCGPEYPEPLRESFLITRFGNLLGTPAAPDDVGFDVIGAKMERTLNGEWQARMTSLLAPLGRPIDVLGIGEGHVLILEYTRSTNFKEKLGWLPGRIIELAPNAK